MRVISGNARGAKLLTLEGLETRPTLDRVKEPLFSIIQSNVRDAKVLDLFAGSGALGLEALSRGAKSCVFCDVSEKAINVIKQNITKIKVEEKSTILTESFEQVLMKYAKQKESFDLIFLDPPYASGYLLETVDYIYKSGLLNVNGIIIVETDDETELQRIQSVGFYVKDIRKYGRIILLFLERKG